MGGGAGGAGARAPVCLRRVEDVVCELREDLELASGSLRHRQRRGTGSAARNSPHYSPGGANSRCHALTEATHPSGDAETMHFLHALTCRNEYGLNKSNLCVGMPRRLVQTDCLCDHPRHTTSAPHTSQRHTGAASRACTRADHIMSSPPPRGSPTRANRGESQSRSTELEIDGELQFSENSPKRRPRLDRRPNKVGRAHPTRARVAAYGYPAEQAACLELQPHRCTRGPAAAVAAAPGRRHPPRRLVPARAWESTLHARGPLRPGSIRLHR